AAHRYPFAEWGWAAWALFAVLGWRSLIGLRERAGFELALAHLAWLWAWVVAAGLTLFRLARLSTQDDTAAFGSGWNATALLLPLLAMAALCLWRPAIAGRPVAQRFGQWSGLAMASFMVVLVATLALTLLTPANPYPLMWIPLLNPLSLMQWAALLMLGFWLASPLVDARLGRRRMPVLAAGGFVLVTTEVLRTAHFWGHVAWDASMFSTSLVQTSLTVVWSALGVAGWIAGSRRGQRGLWLASAALMGIVLIKLVTVDRGHLGNLLGIASFIAYGLLCLAVGYFAPAPPSRAEPDDSNSQESKA
ncbi:MAG: DUF2339 domain-containing protein, partial [Lysobacter sp.]